MGFALVLVMYICFNIKFFMGFRVTVKFEKKELNPKESDYQHYYLYQYFILPLYLNPQFWTKWRWDQNHHCGKIEAVTDQTACCLH